MEGHRPRIPGGSLKGVIRSRIEYVCRVLGETVCTEVSCGSCRACTLFGWSPTAGHEGGGRTAVVVRDALVDKAVVEPRTHVVLDRVTGGARPSLLYTEGVFLADPALVTW